MSATEKELREALDDTWDQFRRVADESNSLRALARRLAEELRRAPHQQDERTCSACALLATDEVRKLIEGEE